MFYCFENEKNRKVYICCYLPKVEIKEYNVLIDGKNVFDHPVKSRMKTYDNIQKLATYQGDDYTTVVFWNYIILKTVIIW